jgi:uncharacterized protein YukE
VSELLDAAGHRWAEAAALLAGVGRAPSAVLTWLGPAWSGPAARAYDDWANGFEQATRRTSGALRDTADSIRLLAERWPQLGLQADFDGVDAGSRAITAVPIPGRSADPAVPGPRAELAHAPKPAPRPARRPENVDSWIQQAVAILREHGYRPDQIDPEAIETIIRHESAGDPGAVNSWDVNASRGTPSMGLMQTIGPTFDRWHLPGHGEILDPVDNIVAAVRYAVDRYGSVSRVPGVLSLAAGQAYRGY